MRIISWSASALLFATPLVAQKINPTNQINWPLSTGSGAPSSACTAANYGQPYTDVAGNNTYVCGSTGWTKTNGGGGGGGGVGPGLSNDLAIYNSTSSVIGDNYLIDYAPSRSTSGLSYTGNGITTITNFGGAYQFQSYSPGNGALGDSGSKFTVTSTVANTQPTGAGAITLKAIDLNANAQVSNINISGTSDGAGSANTTISTNGTAGASNAANINLLTNFANTNGSTENSGNVNIGANIIYPGLVDSVGISAAAPATGFTGAAGDINFLAQGTSGNPEQGVILFQATNGFQFIGQGAGCGQFDSNGFLTSTGAACGSGGGGGFPFTLGSTSIAGSSTTSTVTGLTLQNPTLTGTVQVNDGSGHGGGFGATEGTALTGTGGVDNLWADSTAHRLLMNNNNGGNFFIPGIASAGTANDCVKLASNGIDLVDNGSTCSGTNTFSSIILTGATSGQVTIQAQSVAGTPTLQLPTVNGQIALTSAEVVAYSATPTFTPGDSMSRMVLAGNVTSFTMGSAASGTPHALCFEQGSGSYTVSGPANVRGLQSIGTTSAKWNCQNFMYDASDAIWLAIGPMVQNQ